MDEARIGEIGKAFFGIIQARWPQFIPFFVEDGSSDLVINYPSPHRSDGLGLYLLADADLDEMIVGFGGGHSHGGPWREPGDVDYGFGGSIAFIEGILDESVVHAVYESGGGRMGDLSTLKAREDWGSVVTIRSWRGTHDHG